MGFKSRIAKIIRTALDVVAALILATFAFLPTRSQASEVPATATLSSSNPLLQTEVGPERLRQHVRVTVETNAPLVGVATNAAVPKAKSFHWGFFWEDWGGVHYDVSQRTLIKDPLASFRETIQATNAYRIFHLEELKMSGKIGAKLAVDAAAYATGKEFQGFDDGVEVRRARIYAQGNCILLLPVSYELEIGYVPNEFYIENSYLAFRNIRWIGDFQVGQYQAPMGLDNITSSRDITLMETAAPLQALAPGTSAGIEIGRPVFGQRATWKLGLFTGGVSQDTGDAAKNYGRAISRITVLPIYEVNPDHPDSAKFLHLGLSANVLYSSSSSVRYRSRPESHLAPYVIDTGDMEADGTLVAGSEVAWVNGPFSVQGEYLRSWVRENNGQVPSFHGFYSSVSWFLTGESRPYDPTAGAFGRVIPKRNFDFGHGGWGAWEVAGRYSYTDLNSGDINGGKLSMLMTGVNWYLHSHLKWRFDYGFGHITERKPEGNLNVFQTRVEIDF
jgi:phosphate-selective porin OprO and OprP